MVELRVEEKEGRGEVDIVVGWYIGGSWKLLGCGELGWW